MSFGQALGQGAEPSGGPESLFGLDNVIDVHIRINPEEWAKATATQGDKNGFWCGDPRSDGGRDDRWAFSQ